MARKMDRRHNTERGFLSRLVRALYSRTSRPFLRLLRLWSNHFSRGSLPAWVVEERAKVRGEILNVGAGGEIGSLLGDCTSIDLDPLRKPDVVADVCRLEAHFPAASFDAVFLLEVLEHVSEPRRALSEVRRVLKPGGKLVLSTPFFFEMHDLPHDYWRFTEHGLRKLLESFEAVEIERRNRYFRTALTPLFRLWYSRYGTDRIFGLLYLLLALPLYPLILLMDLLIRSDYACTGYHVTAVKPSTR